MSGPYRSMLFVPGQNPSWVDKALVARPDAIILDLEDAVAPSAKREARARVAASVDRCAGETRDTDLWVRPNDVDHPGVGDDLEAAVRPGLTGLVLPKLSGRDDILRYDALTTHFERRAGLEPASVEFIASVETPAGMARCEEIAAAHSRVVSIVGATARDADTARSLGYTFTVEGLETLYLRSRILLASRAAGHAYAVCGMWQDIRDLEGLRRFAERQRGLGYDGQMVIHPSHVEAVHKVYTPSAEQISFYEGMIAASEAAAARGSGSADYQGQHIDIAHLQTARSVVAAAKRLRF